MMLESFSKFWFRQVAARFWWLWIPCALMAAGIFLFFLSGLTSGVVSADNIIPWIGILLIAAAIVGGSFWLRSSGREGLAVIPLFFTMAPAVLGAMGVFLWFILYSLLFIFGHGRMN